MSDKLHAATSPSLIYQAYLWPDDAPICQSKQSTQSKKNFLTAAQLRKRILQWQTLIAQQAHPHLALYLEDGFEFASALLAAWQCQKTVWIISDVLESYCQRLQKQVGQLIGEFPEAYQPITTAHADEVMIQHEELANSTAKFEDLPHDRLALVVFTSGSTGEPQAIPKQMKQITQELITLEKTFGQKMNGTQVVAQVSHQHIYGCLFKVLWPLCFGRVFHAESYYYPEQWLEAIAEKPTSLITSPAHLKRLPTHLPWHSIAPYLQLVFSSGGPLSDVGLDGCQTWLKQTPIEVFGSSETGGIAWRQRDNQKAEQVWHCFSGIQWRLNAHQCLEIQSPYLPDGNWYTTQDSVQLSPDGQIEAFSRSDRLIKIEEKRISLDAVERGLNQHEWIEQAKVIPTKTDNQDALPTPIPAPEKRLQLIAFITLNHDGKQALQHKTRFEINQIFRRFLRKHVESVGIPRRWYYLDAFPHNAQGKITYEQLHQLTVEPSAPRPVKDNRLPVVTQIQANTQANAHTLKLDLYLPNNLIYFEGHFAQAPILPGVVLIDWAIHFAKKQMGIVHLFSGMKAIKFQHRVLPDARIQLHLQWLPFKSILEFSYTSHEKMHASGKIIFKDSAKNGE